MAGTLDPRLSWKLRDYQERRRTRPAAEVEHEGDLLLDVSLTFKGDLSAIVAAGFQTRAVRGETASGTVYVRDLEKVAAAPGVVLLEASQRLSPMLDSSVPAIGAAALHTGNPAYTGTGVIVGIVDSGVDITHRTLRMENGDTRILKLWDQTLQTGGAPPPGFTKGVLFDAAAINGALNSGHPETFPSQDSGHGTHTAGIAAGDGSQSGNCHLANHYVGVAPDANLVIVKTTFDGGDVIDGVDFVFRQAGPPQGVVVNLSLGSDEGAHDGRAWLDRHINPLIGAAGRIVVASSGNAGESQHARKTVAAGSSATFSFTLGAANRHLDFFDIWYAGASRLNFHIQTPLGGAIADVVAGAGPSTPSVDGHTIDLSSELTNPINGMHEISFKIRPPLGGTMANGTWVITLTETAGTAADTNLWISWSQWAEETRSIAASGNETFVFDLWEAWKVTRDCQITYTGAARLDLVVTSPDGDAFPVVTAGTTPPTPPKVGNHFLEVSSVVNVAGTHRIVFRIRRDTSGVFGGKKDVTTGAWRIKLTETAGHTTQANLSMPGDRWTWPEVIQAERNSSVSVGSPAAADNVIAVGSFNHRDGNLAADSGRGPRLDHIGLGAPGLDDPRKPDVVAPGVNIMSAKTGAHGVPLCCDCCVDFYVSFSGTSMAAPHVTGVVALMLQKNAALTYNDARHRLRESADHSPRPNPYDEQWGWGKVRAGGAVALARSALPEPVEDDEGEAWPWFEPIAARVAALQGMLGAIPAGQRIIALVSEHYDEVARLVRSAKRCAAAWRRMDGTEMLRQVLLWRDAQAAPLPARVNDRPLAAGIRRLLVELLRVGSPKLKRDIMRYSPLVLALPGATLQKMMGLEEANLA